MIPRIAITPGEPAGIGPELIVKLAQTSHPAELVVIADADLLKERAQLLQLPLTLIPYDYTAKPVAQQAQTITLLSEKLTTPSIAGQLNVKNAEYVLNTLERATQGCLDKEFDALVTGPIHKGILNEKIPFSGHTEWLAERAGNIPVVMMLATKELRVALATTHVPLRDVADAISYEKLLETIRILHHALQNEFRIENPHILVAGLNPHAGEQGYLGYEELDIIIPALETLRAQGLNLEGPLPADTLFTPKYLKNADAVLAMYHDQGLPVLKYQGFGQAVNITLGLPFLRTSVDHGTALDIAGSGIAKVTSLEAAVTMVIGMLKD